LFVGGRRGGRQNAVELLPAEPDIDGLPETAAQDLFETLSAADFALFWPSNDRHWPHTDADPDDIWQGHWQRAHLDPETGVVTVLTTGGAAKPGRVSGYLWHRDLAARDHHGRRGTDPGTAVPYECPACFTDYYFRAKQHRLSPIRNFRTGFAKSTQLLATELFDLLRLDEASPKLVSFSDSRQDAAKAALDIESRHHEDLRREILIDSLRTAADGRPSASDLLRQLTDVQSQMKTAMDRGDFDAVAALGTQQLRVRGEIQRNSGDEIRLSDVLEVTQGTPTFLGPSDSRERLRALVAQFVHLGVHPVDPAGTRRIRVSEQETFAWEQLFRVDPHGHDWRDDPVQQNSLNMARQVVVKDLQRLIAGIVFSKTYFALEETGLAYPCVPTATPDEGLLNSFLRVFGDAYRLIDNPWSDRARPQDMPPEWASAHDIPRRDRVRRYAERIWPATEVNERLDHILAVLGAVGHQRGFIFTGALAFKVLPATLHTSPDSISIICRRLLQLRKTTPWTFLTESSTHLG
jgi:hypothetical protein